MDPIRLASEGPGPRLTGPPNRPHGAKTERDNMDRDIQIAALYVVAGGPYFGIDGVEPWAEERDARRYIGPYPVVAHPPCGPWGAYAKAEPESKARGPLVGHDGGCFAAALASVRMFGGVIEHPQGSKAWDFFNLPKPPSQGWQRSLFGNHTAGQEWVCCVEQGHYGHPARKPTWLYLISNNAPPALKWGKSKPGGTVENQSARQRKLTPRPFQQVLLSLARLNHHE